MKNLFIHFIVLVLVPLCGAAKEANAAAPSRNMNAFQSGNDASFLRHVVTQRKLQAAEPPTYCDFDKQSCTGTFWTSCRAMGDKIDDQWCFSLQEQTTACCGGSYNDCCKSNSILYAVVIVGSVLVIALAILACCYYIPSCPLRVHVEKTRNKA